MWIFISFQKSDRFNLAVDVGCGSGQGTRLLAPYFTKVVGTDISPAQLEMATTNDNPPNVSYRQSPAEELLFSSNEVDLVTAMTAAHWFNHQRFLQEADRVLRPGGCLAILSYTMDMELEYGDISDMLNKICEECYEALLPFWSPCLGANTIKIYSEMYDSCSYNDKVWNDCMRIRRMMPLKNFIGIVQSFSMYQLMKQNDAAEAQRVSSDLTNKLLCAMSTSSLDTEVTVVMKYISWMACKPRSL
ncbi:putative methyltransferase DDB_G0268948 isoform X1 [Thalassophryne amazonica]|uniref:putative methyltransferase DDB_G0268948 isoform X1 n=1 Tax=Thalassophryne amazonica TaxID=390379 RepID=UPI001471E45B|nr:putative methyltransferase DDB_G0268948 isoform X1 [Thalassophryne amazonica]